MLGVICAVCGQMAFAQLPPSPVSVTDPSVSVKPLASPKGAEIFSGTQMVRSSAAAPMIAHPLDTTNAPPIAVITILDAPTPPELKSYALEAGLNTMVPVSIRLGATNDVVLTYAVKLGKIYQVQFKMDASASWCCAFNDLIPAQDAVIEFHHPIYPTENRFFRVMSNE
jgi:hypothetical protein